MDSSDQSGEPNSNKNSENEDRQTSSDLATMSPEKKAHNINDLKTLDFNSADEIRQTMKAVLSGSAPQKVTDEADNCNILKNNVGIETNSINQAQESTQSPSSDQIMLKTVQTEAKANVFQCINPKNDKWSARECRRKRPGRPPKAGTSKKIKRPSVSAMYIGKLSNVVPFKRRRFGSESESDDIDSLVIFY